jgi:hypothetical protein
MVRLGILKGSGKKLFSAAKLGENYFRLADKEISFLHGLLTDKFCTLPTGPFQAVSYLVGQEQARRLARLGQLVMPDSFLNQTPLIETLKMTSPSKQGSPSKRRKIREPTPETEEEMDVDNDLDD